MNGTPNEQFCLLVGVLINVGLQDLDDHHRSEFRDLIREQPEILHGQVILHLEDFLREALAVGIVPSFANRAEILTEIEEFLPGFFERELAPVFK